MTRPFQFLIVLMLLGLLLLGTTGCNRAAPAAAAANTGAEQAATPERVLVGKPERKTLSLSTSQPGRIEAFEETPLFAKLAGYIEKILVDIGDPIAKGQALVKIAIPEMQDDLEQKRALVAQSEAELKQAEVAVEGTKAAVETADARVEQADAGVIGAKGDFDRWSSEYVRIKELAANRSVNQKVADETHNQLKGAKGAYRAALASVRSSQALLREARVNVQKAEADLGAAAARLARRQSESGQYDDPLGIHNHQGSLRRGSYASRRRHRRLRQSSDGWCRSTNPRGLSDGHRPYLRGGARTGSRMGK